jgi:hypothetical protein
MTEVCDTRPVAEWLTDGARSALAPHQVLAQGCKRLVACGVPLWRVAVFVRTLHPHIIGRRFLWRPDAGVEHSAAPFGLLEQPDFRESTVAHVYETGRALRRKLGDPDCPTDFSLLSELRGEGVTDYLATPLFFTDGAVHVATWTTCRPGGFTEASRPLAADTGIDGVDGVGFGLALLSARIEALTGRLGRAILASADFARHCPDDFAEIGEFALAGFTVPQRVFAPIEIGAGG